MIEAKNLTKVFINGDKRLIALNNLSFTIPTGQFLAITGISGSGKSTLLYQLSLLDRPTEGAVFVDNNEITKLKGRERVNYRLNDLGYIFQDYAILPMLTAQENVMVPLMEQGISKGEAAQKAQEALTKVGLAEKFGNLPSQLSGGQQQRVSVARSIVHNPSILFADEPTANLDTESSMKVFEVFKTLHKEGQTIIMVTHEKEYALLAQRIIELRDGKILRDKMVKSTKKKSNKK